MANLFEGAPPEWLQNFGDDAYNFLDNRVLQWIYDKSKGSQPPMALYNAGDAVYRGIERARRLPEDIGSAYRSMDRESDPNYVDPEWQRLAERSSRMTPAHKSIADMEAAEGRGDSFFSGFGDRAGEYFHGGGKAFADQKDNDQ